MAKDLKKKWQNKCKIPKTVLRKIENVPNFKLSDAEFSVLKNREANFEKELVEVSNLAINKLGYDFNRFYTAPLDLKISEFKFTEEICPQTFSVPISAECAEEIIRIPKFLVKKEKVEILDKNEEASGNAKVHKKYIENYLYVGNTSKGPVLLVLRKHVKNPYQNGDKKMNISFYLLMQGKDYVHQYRYDNETKKKEYKCFDEGGMLTQRMIKTIGSHSHKYNIKHAVIYPMNVAHEDANSAPYFASLKESDLYIRTEMNVYNNLLEIGDETTIYDCMLEISRLTKNKKKFCYKGELVK
ncbi:MAG: hypothetical protein RR400_01225 [Clostridia bacterium]